MFESARFQLFYCTVKNGGHLLSHIARVGPISTVLSECRSANDKAPNMIRLRNTMSTEKINLMLHLLSLLAQVAVLGEILFCALSFPHRLPQFPPIGEPHVSISSWFIGIFSSVCGKQICFEA